MQVLKGVLFWVGNLESQTHFVSLGYIKEDLCSFCLAHEQLVAWAVCYRKQQQLGNKKPCHTVISDHSLLVSIQNNLSIIAVIYSMFWKICKNFKWVLGLTSKFLNLNLGTCELCGMYSVEGGKVHIPTFSSSWGTVCIGIGCQSKPGWNICELLGG